MKPNVLIIEDDREIAELVQMHLHDQGFDVVHAADGKEGLKRALAGEFALVILDLMLPGVDGLEICRRLRESDRGCSILMLTARGEEMDKVLGLDLGADDYLTKPFSVRELVARVKAIIRRTATAADPAAATGPETLTYPGLTVSLGKRRVSLHEKAVELTAKEFDLLAFFARHPGVPFTREQLLDRVWGYSFTGYEHTVNSHINRLRAKIEADPSHPRYIITVWGFGYRFADAEELRA
ncbi:MAG: response regulator transcription factor [Candidatus Lambdaproteobacteria bacterium]|nr:response regulator transcription factor [Candidatus Lambdaproteobacteria bacterium]